MTPRIVTHHEKDLPPHDTIRFEHDTLDSRELLHRVIDYLKENPHLELSDITYRCGEDDDGRYWESIAIQTIPLPY